MSLVIRSFPNKKTKNTELNYYLIQDTMIFIFIDFYFLNIKINFKINIKDIRKNFNKFFECISEDHFYLLKFKISDPIDTLYINNFQIFHVFFNEKTKEKIIIFEMFIDSISNYKKEKEKEQEEEQDFDIPIEETKNEYQLPFVIDEFDF